MILRLHRFTDKFGLVLLKLVSATGEWLIDGTSVLTGTAGGFVATILGLIAAIFGIIFSIIRQILGVIGSILASIFAILRRSFGVFVLFFAFIMRRFFNVSVGMGQSAGRSTGDAMARRAARAQIDATIVEDPLRVQNRTLSVAFVILGVIVIGIVLWATDPSRLGGIPLANPPSDNIASVFSNAPTVEATLSGLSVIAATPIPTATQIPEVLQIRGAIAYVVRESAQDDIWAVNVGSRNAIRLTNDVADERNPAWSPPEAGTQRLAYSSNKEGNWEIYIYELDTDTTTRMTYDLSFQDSPKWSNDGLWLVYESYQGNNLDIYAMPVDGAETPIRLTDHVASDYSPVWSPSDGRSIAFVSTRDGNQEIYLLDLDTLDLTNLTNTPNRNEDYPAWSPDGRQLAYSALELGQELIFVRSVDNLNASPEVLGFGRMPSWSPNINTLSLSFAVDSEDGKSTFLSARPVMSDGVATEVISVPVGSKNPTWADRPLPASLVNSGGLPLGADSELYIEQSSPTSDGVQYKLSPLPNVDAPTPNLSDAVNDSFNALRVKVSEVAGWDVLGQLDDAFWVIDQLPQPGEDRRNWLKTGRAFAMTRSSILGFPPPMEAVREDIGVNTYWHIYIRVADEAQSGQLGEPLRHIPWDFLSRSGGDVEAYNQGGRLKTEIPRGYYIDFTQLAQDYGWEGMPAGNDWRANANTINYWLFRKSDGLDWYNAMLEIYQESQMGGFVPTTTPAPIVPTQEDEG